MKLTSASWRRINVALVPARDSFRFDEFASTNFANCGTPDERRLYREMTRRTRAKQLVGDHAVNKFAFKIVSLLLIFVLIGSQALAQDSLQDKSLDPRGKIHIPIGVANTLDSLKTFVEAEGNFSPGFGSYGIYFWVFDRQTGKLTAPTMDGVISKRGLSGEGHLIPWTTWSAGDVGIKTEVCQVQRRSPSGEIFVVGSRARLTNQAQENREVSLYVALRPLGPAGWSVNQLAVGKQGDALLVDGRTALVSNEKPSHAGVIASDTVGQIAIAGEMPSEKQAISERGESSGALRFDLSLRRGETKELGFICPVLPGRRAVGHSWDGKAQWAQFDEARPNPNVGGSLQPDPGLAYYRKIKADTLFKEATAYWQNLVGRVTLKLPDKRWEEAFAAIVGHVAVAMNEGAPDVSVINYNVYNRDGVYVTNILQKVGHYGLAAKAIDYFLSHPFNGRSYPEADNPGQILWIMGEHWLFTRDKEWLQRVYPEVQKLTSMVRYYRTTPGPHFVNVASLDFGDALSLDKRQELKPGRVDGFHPEYSEAFDIAGLRAASLLADAASNRTDAAAWRDLANSLFEIYDQKFGAQLPQQYGSYVVLWPTHLYPYNTGKGYEQFKHIGAQKPVSWRYFPLARAHQGLLAQNRVAAYETLAMHLDHEQMRGWYAFDEGGRSGTGGWNHVRTTWQQGKESVAMPHGWAIAELHLLLRDSLMFEDEDRLVLLAGVSPEWFTRPEGMKVERLPTHFGLASFDYASIAGGAILKLTGAAAPAGGFVLRLPQQLNASVTVNGKALIANERGDFVLPANTTEARLTFGN